MNQRSQQRTVVQPDRPEGDCSLTVRVSSLPTNRFPRNQSEKLSLNPLLNRPKEDYRLGRLVAVAGKGLKCGYNIAQ